MKKTIIALICAAAILGGQAFAHPGRLDKNGGHYDRSNGTYHYHTGNSSSSTSSSQSSVSVSASSKKVSTPIKKTPKVYSTELKVFIKGIQSTSYCYSGDTTKEVIVAEDLDFYGYDIKWVGAWNTLYVTRNDNKAVVGKQIPYTYTGQFISDVYDTGTVVRLVFADGESYAPPVYSLGGRMIIPVDELKCLGSFRYSAAENAVYID